MPVFNSIAVSRVNRTTIEEQIATVNLNRNEVILRECAALNVQTRKFVHAVIANTDKRRARDTYNTTIILYIAALKSEPAVALNINNIMRTLARIFSSVLTFNRASLSYTCVLNCSSCGNGNSRFAWFCFTVNRMAIQV